MIILGIKNVVNAERSNIYCSKNKKICICKNTTRETRLYLLYMSFEFEAQLSLNRDCDVSSNK